MERQILLRKVALAASVSVLSLLSIIDANAQEPSSSPQQIEQVTVTAERREENAQKVPDSIVAFGRKDIQEKFANSFDVGRFVANVQTDNFFGLTTPRTGIRGVSNADFNPQFNSSIMVYSDNVVINSLIGQALPFFDEDHIEVLRGPQGTLFGRNSTGGAFQYFSAAPTDDFEGYVQATYGSFNKRRIEGAISGPITDGVDARLAILTDNRDGDVTNITRAEKIGTQDRFGFRGAVDVHLDDATMVRFRAQYYTGHDNPAWAFMGIAQAYGGDGFQQTAQQAIGFVNPCTEANKFKCQTSGLEPIETLDHQIYSIDLTHDFGFATLTSTSANVDVRSFVSLDNNQTPNLDMVYELDHMATKQWSEEARLTSNGDSAFKWILGAFYLQETTDVRNDYGLSGFAIDYTAPGFNPLSPISPDFLGLAGNSFVSENGKSTLAVTPSTLYGYAVGRGNQQRVDAAAAYLHTTYQIGKVRLTAAARYNYETRHIGIDFATPDIFQIPGSGPTAEGNAYLAAVKTGNVYYIAPFSSGRQHAKFDAITWDFGADYQIDDQRMVYVTVKKGFKAGGFEPGADSTATMAVTKPENIIDYEGGLKSDWFSHRLRVNADMFYYDYRDFQTNQLVCNQSGLSPCAQILSNLKKARSYGAELEISAIPVDDMLLTLNFGSTNAKITGVTDSGGLDPAGDILEHRLIGNWLPFAEDYSSNGSISYDFHGSFGTITPEIDYSYTGHYYTEKENDDHMQGTFRKRLGGFTTFDARVNWTMPDSRYTVSVFANNVFDVVRPIVNDEIQNGSGLGSDILYINQRRNFGITGSMDF
ncbi:MAG TPA: TonB-dependent receptor [Rhizomicrobium sp.]|jgi:iron complex outermembrane receptor protein